MSYKCSYCSESNVEHLGTDIDGKEICSNCGQSDGFGNYFHKPAYQSTSFVNNNKSKRKDDKDSSKNN